MEAKGPLPLLQVIFFNSTHQFYTVSVQSDDYPRDIIELTPLLHPQPTQQCCQPQLDH